MSAAAILKEVPVRLTQFYSHLLSHSLRSKEKDLEGLEIQNIIMNKGKMINQEFEIMNKLLKEKL